MAGLVERVGRRRVVVEGLRMVLMEARRRLAVAEAVADRIRLAAVRIAEAGHHRVVEVGIGLAVDLHREVAAGAGSPAEVGMDYAMARRKVAAGVVDAAEEDILVVGNLVVEEDNLEEGRVSGLHVAAGGSHPAVDILAGGDTAPVEGIGPAEAVDILLLYHRGHQ